MGQNDIIKELGLSELKSEDFEYLTAEELEELDDLLKGMRPSLRSFVGDAWHVLEPFKPLVWNWHLDVICEHLEAVSAGEITKLVINVPPGTMKSLLVSVFWPVWDWIETPGRRWMTAAYGRGLATRDSVKSRRLLQSPWFQKAYGHIFSLTGDVNKKQRYENNWTGFRVAVSVGGSTGERADIRIVDDPHNIDEAESDVIRNNVIDWAKNTWASRTTDPDNPYEVLIMQRLHEMDLAGYYLKEVGGYEHIMLPMRYEEERTTFTSLGPVDDREEEGELLFPERFPPDQVDAWEEQLGEYGASGQLQQNPSPTGGGIFRKDWWRIWVPPGLSLPPVIVRTKEGRRRLVTKTLPDGLAQCQSWDMTFKDTDSSSYVVGQAWAYNKTERFLLGQERERLDFIKTLAAVGRLTQQFPDSKAKYVEDKANGPAVMAVLRNEMPGLIPVNPEGDKLARARAAAPDVQGGYVYLPHPHICPWVTSFIERFAKFPNLTHKDEIDAFSQMIIQLEPNKRRGTMSYQDFLDYYQRKLEDMAREGEMDTNTMLGAAIMQSAQISDAMHGLFPKNKTVDPVAEGEEEIII